jgi:hypothetical protein
MKCSGSSTETCGGVWANSVYKIQYEVQPLTISYPKKARCRLSKMSIPKKKGVLKKR